MRSFAPEVIMVVAATIPPFSVVVAPKAPVVEMFAVVVPPGRLLVLLDSPDVFSTELICVIGVGVILGRGEEFSNRGRPLAE